MLNKLLDIQKKIGKISKDETNPFFKSKYFDINGLLEALKPVLNEEGLVVIQPLTHIDGKPAIATILYNAILADPKSGEKIEYITPLPESSDPQKMGSAITYFRRYALQSMFLLQAEDDDGNKASENIDKKSTDSNIETTIQCSCGGQIGAETGFNKQKNKHWKKMTCMSCKKITWDNTYNGTNT